MRMAAFVALGKDAAAKRVASSLDLHQQAVFLENLRMIVDTILTEEDQEQKGVYISRGQCGFLLCQLHKNIRVFKRVPANSSTMFLSQYA